MLPDGGPLFAWGAPPAPVVERAEYSVRVGSRRLRTTAVFAPIGALRPNGRRCSFAGSAASGP
jgi:hypothetical protein